MDDFSKYTMLGVLDSHSPAAVVEWLSNTIISVFGVPNRLRVDNGTEFRGELEVLCKLLEVELRRIKPHCPWQNGRAECMIKFCKALVKRIMLHAPGVQWWKILPVVQLAINNTVARATGYAPQEVMMGERARGFWNDWVTENPLPADFDQMTDTQVKTYADKLRHKLTQVQKELVTKEKEYRNEVAYQYS